MSARKRQPEIDDITKTPTDEVEVQKTDKAAAAPPPVDDDGIVIEEPALAELRDLGEIGGNAQVFLVMKTGRVVQGPGVLTEYHYQALTMDQPDAMLESYRLRWRQQGFERVSGVVSQGVRTGHEVWRIKRDRYEEIVRRRQAESRAAQDEIGQVPGPAGADWQGERNLKIGR